MQAVLAGLDNALRKKILKKALQLLAKPILRSAKQKVLAHKRTGKLFRSLAQKAVNVNGETALIIGARKRGRNSGSHAHLLENGTAQRSYITSTGRRHRTGKTTGIRYWTSSIEESNRTSQNDLSTYLITALNNEVRTLNVTI